MNVKRLIDLQSTQETAVMEASRLAGVVPALTSSLETAILATAILLDTLCIAGTRENGKRNMVAQEQLVLKALGAARSLCTEDESIDYLLDEVVDEKGWKQ